MADTLARLASDFERQFPAPAPVERTMPAAEYERLVDDLRELARVAVERRLGARSRNTQRKALLDAWLALHDRETPLVEALGHVRDSEAYGESEARKGECIHDAAEAMSRAAAEYGALMGAGQ